VLEQRSELSGGGKLAAALGGVPETRRRRGVLGERGDLARCVRSKCHRDDRQRGRSLRALRPAIRIQ
jgi:hypothetical protein